MEREMLYDNIKSRKLFESWAQVQPVPYFLAFDATDRLGYRTERTANTFKGFLEGVQARLDNVPVSRLQATFNAWALHQFHAIAPVKYLANYSKYKDSWVQHAYEGFCAGFMLNRPNRATSLKVQQLTRALERWFSDLGLIAKEVSLLLADSRILQGIQNKDCVALEEDIPYAIYRVRDELKLSFPDEVLPPSRPSITKANWRVLRRLCH